MATGRALPPSDADASGFAARAVMAVAGVLLLAAVLVVGLELRSVRGPVSNRSGASSEISQHQGKAGVVAVRGSHAAVKLGDGCRCSSVSSHSRCGRHLGAMYAGAIVAIAGPCVAIFAAEAC